MPEKAVFSRVVQNWRSNWYSSGVKNENGTWENRGNKGFLIMKYFMENL